jgi:BlaI family transcriptional regulator, penicillinase repressor
VVPRISDAELKIMEVLWASSHPLTATEVAQRIAPARGWSLATIKTMLSRLSAKRAVGFTEEGRRYVYTAAIRRDSYVARESRRFVDQLFGGRLSPLVARLAEADALDEDDIAAIEDILRELRK